MLTLFCQYKILMQNGHCLCYMYELRVFWRVGLKISYLSLSYCIFITDAKADVLQLSSVFTL